MVRGLRLAVRGEFGLMVEMLGLRRFEFGGRLGLDRMWVQV